jgi:hypothetical protein
MKRFTTYYLPYFAFIDFVSPACQPQKFPSPCSNHHPSCNLLSHPVPYTVSQSALEDRRNTNKTDSTSTAISHYTFHSASNQGPFYPVRLSACHVLLSNSYNGTSKIMERSPWEDNSCSPGKGGARDSVDDWALCYKPEGQELEPRWGHWIFQFT